MATREIDDDIELRDYFAAQVMHGLCSKPGWQINELEIAHRAYAIADAMLAVRQGEPVPPSLMEALQDSLGIPKTERF